MLTFWHAASDGDMFQPMIDVDFAPAHPERLSFSSDGRLLACHLNDKSGGASRRFVRVLRWKSPTKPVLE